MYITYEAKNSIQISEGRQYKSHCIYGRGISEASDVGEMKAEV